jgi:hypothetical protein
MRARRKKLCKLRGARRQLHGLDARGATTPFWASDGDVQLAGWGDSLRTVVRRLLRCEGQLPTWVHQHPVRRGWRCVPGLHDGSHAVDMRLECFPANLRERADPVSRVLPELPFGSDDHAAGAREGLLDRRAAERRHGVRRRGGHDGVQRFS